jgi:hypothetical protein
LGVVDIGDLLNRNYKQCGEESLSFASLEICCFLDNSEKNLQMQFF